MKFPVHKALSVSAASAIILSLGLGSVPAASADSTQGAPAAPAKLAQEIGQHGAKMGQGLDRIKNNQNPQNTVPDQPTSFGKSSFTAQATWRPAGVQGLDVSSWQGSVNWAAQKSMGARFAYVKATEGTGYKSPSFGSQYMGAYNTGLIRGAYHFALPSTSSGKAQADYFVNNGGGWSGDGKTLPPLLDVEYNPYPSLGNMCYNMTPAQMVTWISDFNKQMIARTGRAPAIYTTNDWWKTCTGNSAAFKNNPLHLASYSTVVGSIPASWGYYSIWQYSDSGPFAGDSNVWNGTEASLATFARGAAVAAPVAPKPVAPKPPVAAPAPPVVKPIVKTPVAQFRDVPSTHPYFTEINWMKTAGITTGWSAVIYNPNAVVNRGDLSVFLYRVAGKPAYTAPKVSRFKDVKVGHPFYKEIHWAAAKGLSTGWADGTYRPAMVITRDAMAVYMYRAAGSPKYTAPKVPLYKDVKVGSTGYKEIHWLMSTGVGSVWADKTYRPRVALTRSAAAYYLYRFDKKF